MLEICDIMRHKNKNRYYIILSKLIIVSAVITDSVSRKCLSMTMKYKFKIVFLFIQKKKNLEYAMEQII